MAFSFAFIYWTFSVENVGSDISEPLNLKNFLGEHAPRPPSLQYLRRSNRSFCACTFKTSATPRESYCGTIAEPGLLWFYFNKEGPIDRSPAESLYHILNLDFSPRLSYGVSVHSSDNKLNFNVLTFIINAKLSLTLCFCLYCSNSWTNDIFLQFIPKHKTLLSRCSWVQSAFRIKNALNAMKGKTSSFRLFLYRRYSLLYSYLWLT